jgi:DNA-directed RNA polymerase specialized sigma subunit
MRRPAKQITLDETWARYQASKHEHERRIEPHAALCLHYAPLAKYLALRYLPALEQNEEPPLLIAVAWLELSRAINDWSEPVEAGFRDWALERVRRKVEARVAELNGSPR